MIRNMWYFLNEISSGKYQEIEALQRPSRQYSNLYPFMNSQVHYHSQSAAMVVGNEDQEDQVHVYDDDDDDDYNEAL